MSGLRLYLQHDRRFARRRSKTDIAANWICAGRAPAPSRWRFDRKQSYRGQSRLGPEQRPPTYRARRSPSAPGRRANRRRKRPKGRLSRSTEQIVAGASSNIIVARIRPSERCLSWVHSATHGNVRAMTVLAAPIADGGCSGVYEYTPSPADPHKLGVGAVMKFPTSPETKRGALLVWNGLKSAKTHKQLTLDTLAAPADDARHH